MRAAVLALAALFLAAGPPVGVGCGGSGGAAEAASFDCAKASAPTDVAICSNPTLSALDSQLGAAYAVRLVRDPSARQIERGWLVARNDGCGHDVGCLTMFTRAQLDWLQGVAQLPGTMPTRPGVCSLTAVKEVTSRLEGMPDSGSAIEESNGGYQVSYQVEPGITTARAGDPVLLCLVSLPQDCPPGDDRGKDYAGADLRTLKGWNLGDSEHMCGGA
jgi:uncharacterized protein